MFSYIGCSGFLINEPVSIVASLTLDIVSCSCIGIRVLLETLVVCLLVFNIGVFIYE